MTPETGQKIAYLICFAVISIAVVGYFVGLQSPMNPAAQFKDPAGLGSETSPELHAKSSLSGVSRTPNAVLGYPKTEILPATHYAAMHTVTKAQAKTFRTSLTDLHRKFDPYAEVKITPAQKAFALELRQQNRAFNGAPPTIPHGIEQMSAESCMACHGEGFKSASLRISKMSHQFLANCTQCHVENNPSHMPAKLFSENSFVGLPAPQGGPRAYQGAPPMIPHSTWMRVNCMSCHGFSSEQGIRTTHPWRRNCQQCHASSSELDQVLLPSEPQFLAPPKINR